MRRVSQTATKMETAVSYKRSVTQSVIPQEAAMFINKAVDISDRYHVVWPFAILNVSFPEILLHYQFVLTFLPHICALPY